MPPQPASGHLLPLARGRRDIQFFLSPLPRRNFANFYSFPRGERVRVRGNFSSLDQSTHKAKPPQPAFGHLLPLVRGRRDILFSCPLSPAETLPTSAVFHGGRGLG